MAEEGIRAYGGKDFVLDRPPQSGEPAKDPIDLISKLLTQLQGNPEVLQSIVTGPGAEKFLSMLPPRLATFMKSMPEEVRVRNVNPFSNSAGEFIPQGPIKIGSPASQRLGTIAWGEASPDVAAHEALHALALRKSQIPVSASQENKVLGSYLPLEASKKITNKAMTTDPTLQQFSNFYTRDKFPPNQVTQETAIEALTRNMLSRQLPRFPTW